MKRLLVSLLLVMTLLSGSAMAKTTLIDNINLEPGMPVVNKPVSATIAVVPSSASVDFNADRNWMCQFLDKYSGLDITWLVIDPSAAKERIPLMLNSGDMRDAILGNAFGVSEIVQYGLADQLFYPVNELLEYMPVFASYLEQNPSTRAAITATDGNIYGFPSFPNIWSYACRFFVNAVWLENVGLENPKTLQAFKDMLIAFRDQDANGNGDPNDEIPWAGSWNNGASERQYMFMAYGFVTSKSGDNNIVIDYNGTQPQITYMPYEESYKSFLTYMNDLWNEGLLDPDMFTQAEAQLQATVMEGVAGFCSMSAPYVYDPEHQDDWDSINVLVDNEGDTPVFPGPDVAYVHAEMVINADCDEETAAALVNLADWFYSMEGYGYATYGPEAGSELDWNHDGHYYDAESNTILYNIPKDMPSAWVHRVTNLTIWNVPGFSHNGYDPYRLAFAEQYPDSAIGQQYKDGIVNRRDEDQQQQKYSPYYVEAVPPLFFTSEDMSRMNELKTPLDDYVANMEAKFITGAASIEKDYGAFLETLEKYGVQEYIGIYAKYFEDYKASNSN